MRTYWTCAMCKRKFDILVEIADKRDKEMDGCCNWTCQEAWEASNIMDRISIKLMTTEELNAVKRVKTILCSLIDELIDKED